MLSPTELWEHMSRQHAVNPRELWEHRFELSGRKSVLRRKPTVQTSVMRYNIGWHDGMPSGGAKADHNQWP